MLRGPLRGHLSMRILREALAINAPFGYLWVRLRWVPVMYDYVIVVGGSAGVVMATRRSEMPDAEGLPLEAGPSHRNPYIHMPCGFFKMTGGPLTWGYRTAPARHAGNRQMVYPQARVLGGGSSINAQI